MAEIKCEEEFIVQYRCPHCKGYYSLELTDLNLPESKRTQANLWKAKYFEMHKAVVQANKGIRRLHRRGMKKHNDEKSVTEVKNGY